MDTHAMPPDDERDPAPRQPGFQILLEQSQQALRQRLRYEKGLSECSRALLRGEPQGAGTALSSALRPLRRSCEVDRVYVFENVSAPDGSRRMRQIAEVCAPGVPPQIDNPRLQDLPYDDGLQRWADLLERGEPVAGVVTDMSATERSVLAPQGIQAILLIPLFVAGAFFGYIGFDDTRRRRSWLPEDIRLLRTAAEMIGSHIARGQAEAALKGYSEDLEALVAQRTAKLRRAYQESESDRNRIDAIVKSVAGGLIVTDTHHAVVLMNRAAEEMLGVRLSDAISRPIHLVIRDDVLRERIVSTAMSPIAEATYDFRAAAEGPHVGRMLRARTAAISGRNDDAVGVVTIINDVTREHDIERMKNAFISVAAHELRTPLTSIRGFSELLLTRDNLNAGERRRCLEHIHRQAINLNAIVSDLLDIARIESGRGLVLTREPWPAETMLGDVMAQFEAVAQRHRLAVDFPSPSVTVPFDRERMRQVVRNLVGNAVKYSPQGGRIRLQGEIDGGWFHVSVEDEGIGMTSGQMNRVGQNFYRADTSDTAPEGAGLGMSIVKHIVEAHGGRLAVESRVGVGTTVTFRLPLEIAAGPGADSRPATSM